MMRPTRNDMLMEMAHATAKRSTCNRLNVGAVISRAGRVLSTGYNGPVAGLDHCNHRSNGQPCERAVHAETNAIAFAARHGVAIEGAILHVTHMPCLGCARLIVNSGLVTVVYQVPYRDLSGIELLSEAGIRSFPYFIGME